MDGEFFLSIKHTTLYDFSKPIYLEPHTLFFHPAPTSYYSLEEYRLEIVPKPDGNSPVRGLEGQLGSLVWFSGMHTSLQIDMESVLRVSPYNPFSFLIYPVEFTYYPFRYPQELGGILFGYLHEGEPLNAEVRNYADRIISQADSSPSNQDNPNNQKDTLSLLRESTRFINKDFALIERISGSPLNASQTFSEQKGSCRDLAYLQICLFRHWGIAARFVSGYLYLDIPEQGPTFELHAWVEVYLPGAGWTGVDPSHGLFTDHHYIPVTRSQIHSQTLPVNGNYRGTAKSELSTQLKIEKHPVSS